MPKVIVPVGLIVTFPVLLNVTLLVPPNVAFPVVASVVNAAALGVILPMLTLSSVPVELLAILTMPPVAVKLPVNVVDPPTVKLVNVPGMFTILLDKLVLVNKGTPL